MSFIERLFSGDPDILKGFGATLGAFSVNFTVAVLILALTLWASRWAAELARRGVGRLHHKSQPDPTLQSFISSGVRYVVVIVGLVAVLQQVGVRTTSIIAVLGAASLAVGLALQGALANVAAGVMLLLFRPYRVGDEIEIGGKRGVVKSLDLFVTELATLDNVRIVAPNGKVFGDFILNFTHYKTRRAEVSFLIDLKEDHDMALAVLRDAAAAEPQVLADPAPAALAIKVADSWVEVALRAWTRREDYAAVRSKLIVAGLTALRDGGFSPAYPHQVAVEAPQPALRSA